MDFELLRAQASAHLALLVPPLRNDAGRLVDECLDNARKAFRDEFIRQLSPAAWAKISLIYVKHFAETGTDLSVAEIVAAVVRDSLHTQRMDMVTQQLTQEKIDAQPPAHEPELRLISNHR